MTVMRNKYLEAIRNEIEKERKVHPIKWFIADLKFRFYVLKIQLAKIYYNARTKKIKHRYTNLTL